MEAMEDFRMADPEFVNFEPRSATQAIIRFRRMQRLGLDPWRYPEAFIECCKLLPGKSKAQVKLPLPVPSCSEEKIAHS